MDENTMPSEKQSSQWIVAISCSALVLFIAAGGVFALRDQLLAQSRADGAKQATEREKLANRIDALQTSVDILSNQPKPEATTLAGDLATANSKIAALTARIETLEKKLDEKKPEPVAMVVPPPAPAPAPVAAPAPQLAEFTALKLAALSGKPFSSELAAWIKLHPAAEKSTSALADVAQTGIIGEAELSRKLLEALDAKQPTAPMVEDTSLAGKINMHLKGLVSIKKAGVNDPYADLRKQALREDAATLQRYVEALSEANRTPLEGWLKLAQTRAAALADLSKLTPDGGAQ